MEDHAETPEVGLDLVFDPDPAHWAERFTRFAVQNPQATLDKQMMTDWFSAAIAAGRLESSRYFARKLRQISLSISVFCLLMLVAIVLLSFRVAGILLR